MFGARWGCLVLGCPCPVVGQLVLSEGAHYQDGRGPVGVPDGRMICTRWWWGCPVAACLARCWDIRCSAGLPTPGMLGVL